MSSCYKSLASAPCFQQKSSQTGQKLKNSQKSGSININKNRKKAQKSIFIE
jgi:hypothetical protein